MVHPNVPAILFTPICPHSLSFRPVILPDYADMELKVPQDARQVPCTGHVPHWISTVASPQTCEKCVLCRKSCLQIFREYPQFFPSCTPSAFHEIRSSVLTTSMSSGARSLLPGFVQQNIVMRIDALFKDNAFISTSQVLRMGLL